MDELSARDRHDGGLCAGYGWCDYCEGLDPDKEDDGGQ